MSYGWCTITNKYPPNTHNCAWATSNNNYRCSRLYNLPIRCRGFLITLLSERKFIRLALSIRYIIKSAQTRFLNIKKKLYFFLLNIYALAYIGRQVFMSLHYKFTKFSITDYSTEHAWIYSQHKIYTHIKL